MACSGRFTTQGFVKLMDEEKSKITPFPKPEGTIEIQSHPEDVIDVDLELLATMNSRLRGEDLSEVYSSDDRVSKELLIKLETDKLRRIFASPEELSDAFMSLKNIKAVRDEFRYEEVNRAFLSIYAFRLSSGQNVDEVDFYMTLLFKKPLISKQERLHDRPPVLKTFPQISSSALIAIIDYYGNSHFEPIGISRETFQLIPELRQLVNGGTLVALVNQLLSFFYRDLE